MRKAPGPRLLMRVVLSRVTTLIRAGPVTALFAMWTALTSLSILRWANSALPHALNPRASMHQVQSLGQRATGVLGARLGPRVINSLVVAEAMASYEWQTGRLPFSTAPSILHLKTRALFP